MTPLDRLSEHFCVGEFFAEQCFPDPPYVELALTRLFIAEVLEPVRVFLDRQLIINTEPGADGARQACGWRLADQMQNQPGSAGRGSDHMILAVNPLAVGAVDIISGALSAAEIWAAFVLMATLGRITPPREVIHERRAGGGTGWVHVGYPEGFKQRELFDFELGASPKRKARAAPWYGEQVHRAWAIYDTSRMAANVGPVFVR